VLIAPFALLFVLGGSSPPDDAAPVTAAAPSASISLAVAPDAVVDAADAADDPAAAQGGGKGAKQEKKAARREAKAEKEAEGEQGWHFVWKEHPSLRYGRAVKFDFSTKLQADRMWPGDDPTNFDDFILKRARWQIEGELWKFIQFTVERELTSNDVKITAQSTKTQWRDLYIELNVADWFQVRGGRFKIPFSLDQLTGPYSNDFVYRSLGGDYLAPARDVGGMVHGRFFKRSLNYWAGYFQHDGDNSRSNKQAGGDNTFAVRVSAVPLKKVKGLALDSAQFGVNFADTDVSDESPLANGLRGRTAVSQFTYFDPVYVKGKRRRYGTDLEWGHKQFGGRAEWIYVSEQRTNQGLRGETVPDAHDHAWYVSGNWVVTGEKSDRSLDPKHPVYRGGVGALQVAARFDRLWFDSDPTGEPAFANQRAEVILPSGDKVWTLGVNWYPIRWVKLQMNGIHEEIEDPGRTPLASGGTKFWSGVLRMQFTL
jgi:phosphate-selective porin OprO/OprP